MKKPAIPLLLLISAAVVAYCALRSPPVAEAPVLPETAVVPPLPSAADANGARPAGEQMMDHGRFKGVHLYLPAETPKGLVLLLSGDGHWHEGPAAMAQTLVKQGAVVAGIDTPQFLAALEADGGECVYPDGDLENLARTVEAYAKIPGYVTPWIVGYSSGATLAYAVLAQAPQADFAGGVALGFCPDLELKKPICTGEGLHFEPQPKNRKTGISPGVDFLPRPDLGVPFLSILGDDDPVCEAPQVGRFLKAMPAAHQVLLPGVSHDYGDDPRGLAALSAAYQSLAAQQAPAVPPAPADLGDLPVVEEPVDGDHPVMAMFWSGDGGWAGIDKEVASALNAKGISVVGVDSLRYFWAERTPEGIARDIEKIARHYLTVWHKQKLLLVGYSQGADVLPFAINRLAPDVKNRVALAAAMGLSDHAVFEFQVTNWVSDNNDGPETLPEVRKITGLPFLCVYGEQEDDTICPKLEGSNAKVVKLPGGHHFDGAYDVLAQTILDAVPGAVAGVKP